MGLFGFLKKGNKRTDDGDLSKFSGMRIEVMDPKERLLFVARAGVSWSGGMELRPITPVRLRQEIQNYPVLLRGYRDSEKKALHMQGAISGRKDGAWNVNNVIVTARENDRTAYRQETSLRAETVPLRQYGVSAQPCRVVDLSTGGVCIHINQEFLLGERLLLKIKLSGEAVTPLMCAVRRSTRRGSAYEYGCEFLDLTPQLEETISKAIMAMQAVRRRTE